ncbi:unnamed protein product [Gemmataceae bacterium]|nr:unnamed protein product [Gemmataceae bacterium]VTT96539.1 unnamed protein product [Gemmataceae bacterium]
MPLPHEYPRWTPEEKRLLRELYATAPVAELVARLKRPIAAIYQHAKTLGLHGTRKWRHPSEFPQEVLDQVRALHAEGHSDAAIARRLGRPEFRRSVSHIRKEKLGLPVNDRALAEGRRRAIESQRKTLGIRHGGDLRSVSFRRYARECGWPEDLPPRAVQILNVLAEHGPQTKLDLARAIGMPTDVIGSNGSLKLLHGSRGSRLMRGHGTYTGLLVARGLVVQTHRSVGPGNGRRQGVGRLPSVFVLTPAAITARETIRGSQQRGERGREAAVHGADTRPGPGGHAGPRRPGGVGRAAQGGGEEGARRAGRRGDRAEAGRAGKGR